MILSYHPSLEISRKFGIIIAAVGIIMVSRINVKINLFNLNLYLESTKPMIELVNKITSVSTIVTSRELRIQEKKGDLVSTFT